MPVHRRGPHHGKGESINSSHPSAYPSARFTSRCRDGASAPARESNHGREAVRMLSRFTTDAAGSPSRCPTRTSTAIARIVDVMRLRSNTGRRPAGQGRFTHRISNCFTACIPRRWTSRRHPASNPAVSYKLRAWRGAPPGGSPCESLAGRTPTSRVFPAGLRGSARSASACWMRSGFI